MPIEQIPDSDVRYYLVAFDGEGRERTDDPAGLMSERVVSALDEQPVTDVFVMSHGWRADVPSARRQYAAWIGAMLACTDDLAFMRATRPDFRPLLFGLHWPSETGRSSGGCGALVLIGAKNPCPCGYYGDPRRACSCAPGAIGRYQKRQSIGGQSKGWQQQGFCTVPRTAAWAR